MELAERFAQILGEFRFGPNSSVSHSLTQSLIKQRRPLKPC